MTGILLHMLQLKFQMMEGFQRKKKVDDKNGPKLFTHGNSATFLQIFLKKLQQILIIECQGKSDHILFVFV